MSNKAKPSKTEDEYFAKEEAEKKKRLHDKVAKAQIEENKETTRDIWFMTCPKCAGKLEEIVFRGVKIDKCPACNGVWLDDGELPKLAGPEEKSVINELLNLFKPGS